MNLTTTLTQLTELTKLEIENKQKHQAVLEQMSETLKQMAKPKPSIWSSIKKLISSLIANIGYEKKKMLWL
jgi:hypothetical protein